MTIWSHSSPPLVRRLYLLFRLHFLGGFLLFLLLSCSSSSGLPVIASLGLVLGLDHINKLGGQLRKTFPPYLQGEQYIDCGSDLLLGLLVSLESPDQVSLGCDLVCQLSSSSCVVVVLNN